MKTILFTRGLLALGVLVVTLVPLGCTSSNRSDRYSYNTEHTYGGRISDIDRDDREVTIQAEDTSRTFRLANDAEIFQRDGRHTDIGDLRVGDRVIVYFSRRSDRDLAMRIVPEDVVYDRSYSYRVGESPSYRTEEAEAERHYTGTVTGISSEGGTLTLNIANPSKEGATSDAERVFNLTPDTRIILENEPDATLDNIHNGDRVTIVYHQEGGELVADRIGPMGIVVAREMVSPSYKYRSTSGPRYSSSGSTRQHTLKGPVVSLNSETRTVTVKGFSTNYKFQLGDNADIVLANSAVSRSLRSLRIGDEVEISYTENPEGRIAHSIVVRGVEKVPE